MNEPFTGEHQSASLRLGIAVICSLSRDDLAKCLNEISSYSKETSEDFEIVLGQDYSETIIGQLVDAEGKITQELLDEANEEMSNPQASEKGGRKKRTKKKGGKTRKKKRGGLNLNWFRKRKDLKTISTPKTTKIKMIENPMMKQKKNKKQQERKDQIVKLKVRAKISDKMKNSDDPEFNKDVLNLLQGITSEENLKKEESLEKKNLMCINNGKREPCSGGGKTRKSPFRKRRNKKTKKGCKRKANKYFTRCWKKRGKKKFKKCWKKRKMYKSCRKRN